jgi:signal transduction histidine kinase
MTIRTRLTLWFAAALSITIVVFSVLVWRTFADQLRSSLDDALRVHAEDVRAALDAQGNSIVDAVDPERPGIVTAVLRPTGGVLRAGSGFPTDVANLPIGASTRTVGTDQTTWLFETLDAGQGRMVAAASRTDEIDRSLQHLAESLLAIGSIAVLASVGSGWFLAGRFLSRIRRLNDEAAEIGAHDVRRRLSVGGHDEVGRLAHTLNGFLARVQAANERERMLITGAAHDLRTPVAALRGELELGVEATTVEQARTSLRQAHGDAVRLSELADGLLALAEVEAETIADPPRSVPLVGFVNEVLEDVEWEAETRRVHLHSAVPDVVVPIARVRLGRALTNLVRNAIRHGPRDETVEIWASVTAAEPTDADHLRLEVRDRGPGISEPVRDAAFAPREPGMSGQPSAGLGLATVAAAMRSLGGRAGWTPRPGGGSVLWLEVPLGGRSGAGL